MHMDRQIRQKAGESLKNFRLPRYREIPGMGLYLEQTANYITDLMAPLGDYGLTGSMISNYVKKGLLNSPVKKQYSRDQIAYLFFISVAKTVLSLDALEGFIQLQKQTYPLEVAYDYFCRELEEVLQYTFELSDSTEIASSQSSLGKRLLFSCIVAVSQKIYLEKTLAVLAQTRVSGDNT